VRRPPLVLGATGDFGGRSRHLIGDYGTDFSKERVTGDRSAVAAEMLAVACQWPVTIHIIT
jgi:hypothetical protein